MSRTDPDGKSIAPSADNDDAVPTDGIAGIHTRRSLQARRSVDRHRRSSSSLFYPGASDREGLMRNYDAEASVGLSDLVEDNPPLDSNPKRTSSSHYKMPSTPKILEEPGN